MISRYLAVVGIVALVAVTVGVAQEQPVEGLPAPEPVPWAQKLSEAVAAGEAVVFTVDEASIMLADIVALDQARVADVAISAGQVYVISVGGAIVARADLPSRPEGQP